MSWRSGALVAMATLAWAYPAYAEEDPVEARLSELESWVKSVDWIDDFGLGGRIETDYNLYGGAYNADAGGEPASELFGRRVRIMIETEHGDFDQKTIVELLDEGSEILLARVRWYAPDGHVVKIGKIREDISLQALTSSKRLAIMERSTLADMFSPYFRWGIGVYRYLDELGLRYALGVYKNDAQGAAGKDDFGLNTLAVSGRINGSWAFDDARFHVGAWYSWRDFGGSTLAPRMARGEVRRTTIRLVDYAAGGAQVELDELNEAGFELVWQQGPVMVQAEAAARRLGAEDSSAALDGAIFSSMYLEASWFPGGQVRSYSTSRGVFDKPNEKDGIFELAARVGFTDGSAEGQGTEVLTGIFGANYHFDKHIKLMTAIAYSNVGGAGREALVGRYGEGLGLGVRFQYML